MINQRQQDGFILVSLLTSFFLILLVGIATTQLVLNNYQNARGQRARLQSQFAADSAIDYALQQINQDHNWLGSAETQLFEDDQMRATYESTVTDGPNAFTKYINVTGRSYLPKDAAEPRNTRSYVVELRGVGGGNYSIVTGVGGLTMRNSARILDGSVYINGSLSLSNSAQIGLAILPTGIKVQVAHQNCPVPASALYPRVCGSGENGEPISLKNSARIYGEVQGTNQTTGSGMSNPGLVAGSPPAIELPEYDRDAQKAAVTSTMTGSQASCSLGIKNWPANLKITGDVTISNLCTVNVQGPVWITGDLSVRNIGTMNVGLGVSEKPVIMVDGSDGVELRNAGSMLPNLGLVGFRVITYYSRASCSPDCANVTGTDLYNSQNDTTIQLRNASTAPFSEFYARWSKLEVDNSGNVGAVVGQQIDLSNAAAITFGTSVSDLDTPSAWVIKSYKRVFN